MATIDPHVAAALAARPLSRLTHFTPARNLSHIVENGALRSVKDLSADVRACYTPTDRRRLDGQPDKVCCSLEYPNVFYFDHAKSGQEATNYPDWVCLILDKAVASYVGTQFCTRNAAANVAKIPGVTGLEACYADAVTGQGRRIRERGPRHNPACPTDVQAEVLVPAPIPVSDVRGIVFPSEPAAQEEHGRLDRFNLLPPPHIEWLVSPGFFSRATVTSAVQRGLTVSLVRWAPTVRGVP
jgi:hypothetical protein